MLASHRANDVAVRLATIPGIGPIGASALAASVTDPLQFKSGREFAAVSHSFILIVADGLEDLWRGVGRRSACAFASSFGGAPSEAFDVHFEDVGVMDEPVDRGERHGGIREDLVPFAAWLGLTPLQKSSGRKERQGRISKMGDKYLRKLLIVGMTSLVRRAKYKPDSVDPYLANLLARKPARVATVAMANKAARTAWAIMARGGTYRAPIVA